MLVFFLVYTSFSVTAAPILSFESPTPANNTYTPYNYTDTINISILESNATSDADVDVLKFNWNETNYTFFDDSLVLGMNFDNLSAVGDSTTNVRDFSIYENNGTKFEVGGPAWNTSGKYNGALSFDGIDDYVDCGNDNNLDFTDSFTLKTWIKADTVAVEYQVMIDRRTAGFAGYTFILIYDELLFGFDNHWHITVAKNLVAGNWYHIVGVFDNNNNKVYIYVNGVSVIDEAETNVPITRSQSLRIGGESFNTPPIYSFNGSIDEVRIYNRALTPDEILMQYYSNLQKYNETQWFLQANITDSAGRYNYFGWANDSVGYENSTETRLITLGDGESCVCSTCDTCEDALNSVDCDIVKLTADITDYSGTCINNPTNFTSKTFNCQDNIIDGDNIGSDHGIYLNVKINNTIQNCNISDFYEGILFDNASMYLKLDEGSGSTAFDSTGNENNGTVQSNVKWINSSQSLIFGRGLADFEARDEPIIRFDDYHFDLIRDPTFLINETGYRATINGNYVMFVFAGNSSNGYFVYRFLCSNDTSCTLNPTTPVLENGSVGSWDANENVQMGSAILLSNGTIRLAYRGQSGGSYGVGLADSTDNGSSFVKYALNPILSESNFTGALSIQLPYQIKTSNGSWIMLMECFTATYFKIYGAYSWDGRSYTPMNNGNPIFNEGQSGSPDDSGVANPKIMEFNQTSFIMGYNGKPTGNAWSNFFAYTTETDYTNMSNWTRYYENPVIWIGSSKSTLDDGRVENALIDKSDFMNNATNIRMWYFGGPANENYSVFFAENDQSKIRTSGVEFFGETTSYINISDSAYLGTENFTIEFLFCPLSQQVNKIFFSKYSGKPAEYEVGVSIYGNLFIRSDVSVTTSKSAIDNDSFISYFGSCHKFTGGYNGTHLLLYIDGNLKGVSDNFTRNFSRTDQINIGRRPYTGAEVPSVIRISNVKFYGFWIEEGEGSLTLNSNSVCSNSNKDISIFNQITTIGDNNTCDTTTNWNDTGTLGCTYGCASGLCNCFSCSDCESKLNDNTICSGGVELASDIIGHVGTCIDDPVNFTNKIFDLQGHTIDGDDVGADSGIVSSMSNWTVRNGVISDFRYGISDTFIELCQPFTDSCDGALIEGTQTGSDGFLNFSTSTVNVFLDADGCWNFNDDSKACSASNVTGGYWTNQSGNLTPISSYNLDLEGDIIMKNTSTIYCDNFAPAPGSEINWRDSNNILRKKLNDSSEISYAPTGEEIVTYNDYLGRILYCGLPGNINPKCSIMKNYNTSGEAEDISKNFNDGIYAFISKTVRNNLNYGCSLTMVSSNFQGGSEGLENAGGLGCNTTGKIAIFSPIHTSLNFYMWLGEGSYPLNWSRIFAWNDSGLQMFYGDLNISNGSLFVDQNVTISGTLSGTTFFGEMEMCNCEEVISIGSTDTWYNVTNYSADSLLGFNFTDDSIVADVNGVFQVSAAICFKGGKDEYYKFSVALNGNTTKCKGYMFTDNENQIYCVPMTCIYNLSVGDRLNLQVLDETNTGSITVYESNVNLK